MLRDRRIIFTASFLRAVANGLIGVLAGIYLAQLGFDPAAWGAVLGAGIAGTAVGAAGVMFWGDRIGRKRWLVALGVLAAAGGIVFAFSSQVVVLGVAAFLGMLNSLGKDRAAALAIEQAILPSTGGDAGRTRAFAWYNVIQDVGHALGAALAVLPPFLRDFAGVDPLDSLRAAVILYAVFYAVTAVLYLSLSSQAEWPTAALPGSTRASVSSTPWCLRILPRACSLSRSRLPEASKSQRSCSCCAKVSPKWTCRRASRISWRS